VERLAQHCPAHVIKADTRFGLSYRQALSWSGHIESVPFPEVNNGRNIHMARSRNGCTAQALCTTLPVVPLPAVSGQGMGLP
jgi:hypothetical protein